MESDHLGSLVRRALDEFEDRDLDVSARRAYRIARLAADTATAHRLHLELRPIGGSSADRVEAVRGLYPDLDYDDARAMHRDVLDAFVDSRKPVRPGQDHADAKVISGSIAELREFYKANQQAIEMLELDQNWSQFAEATQTLQDRFKVFEQIRSYVFDYLVRVEARLAASDTVSATLERHRHAVDAELERNAPELRDQLQAALRTARQEGGEHRSQVLTTCRRILVAIADLLFPARDEPHLSADGATRQVGKGQYRNRILAAVETDTFGLALDAAIGDLAARLDRLDELSQKGVHDEVTEAEMEFGLAQTYLLAGELLRGRSVATQA